MARELLGITQFRDSLHLDWTYRGPHRYDWRYADALAEQSMLTGHPSIWLGLSHYWIPNWITADQFWNGDVVLLMAEFAHEVARRYTGKFLGYLPVIESGYWAAMITEHKRWWPQRPGKTWWDTPIISMMIAMAKAIKDADPTAQIMTSEPWNFDVTGRLAVEDLARPTHALIGQFDEVAARERGSGDWGGSKELCDVISLNVYHDLGADAGWPIHKMLLTARRMDPELKIIVGETSNCKLTECNCKTDRHFCAPTQQEWFRVLAREISLANTLARGEGLKAPVEALCWAPLVTMINWDNGEADPGALMIWNPNDPAKKRHIDPMLAVYVSEFAERAQVYFEAVVTHTASSSKQKPSLVKEG